MTRNSRILNRHKIAPFVAGLMKVGVAYSAVKDFDLDVAIRGFVPLYGSSGQW